MPAKLFDKLAPGPRARAGGGKAADRIDAGAQVDRGRRNFPAFHQRGEMLHGGARRRAEIEVDGDAGVELDAVEHARQRRRRRIQAIAIGVERAGEHQRQPGRAILQVLQRLRVGGRRIGMVDPLHQGPGRPRRAPGDRLGPGRARIKRLDPQPVIGLADQALLERGALERGLDQLAPFRLAGRRKFGGEGEFVGHWPENGTVGMAALLR